MSEPSDQPRVSALGAGGAFRSRADRGTTWLAVGGVFLAFALYGLWRAPVPGVNEPHYLSKARHFWDPGWCARDLFLQSSNPHWVFYASVGSLTRVLSLEQAAWVGRGIVWLALAGGWVALARSVAGGRWSALWSAAVFLGFSATGNLSGEWLIGGVEAKGFAYAAVFSGLAAAACGHSRRAAILLGLAVSFHPVVGLWSVATLAFGAGWRQLEAFLCRSDCAVGPHDHPAGTKRGDAPDNSPAETPHRQDDARGPHGRRGLPAARNCLPAIALFLVGSLPGLIPAGALLFQSAPAEAAREADRLQVFHRLGHHLDPRRFTSFAWGMYAVLLAVWLALRPWQSRAGGSALFFRFVVGTLLIAGGGLAVGFGPRWAGVLKFYPFRLADLFLPIAVALESAAMLERAARRPPPGERNAASSLRIAKIGGHLVAAGALVWALAAPGSDGNPFHFTLEQQANWRDVCRWVAEHTPADALFLTPRHNYTFRWYAGRAEYATWKDCPQDAPSLVEWDRRLALVRRWRAAHFDTGFTTESLVELRELTGVDYVVAWSVDPYRVPPEYENRWFRVYRLTATRAARSQLPPAPSREAD